MRLSAVVIDLAILGPQAWDYLERLCAELPGLGVVVCTGRSTVAQRVRGLRLGADDWVTKPCHPEELIARVEAVGRRRRRSEPRVGGDRRSRPASSRSAPTSSRPSSTAARSTSRAASSSSSSCSRAPQGRVLEREEIYQRVWGYAMARGDRSVDVFVRKLRQKLEKASPDWRYIHTHFGVGYRFAAGAGGGRARDPGRPAAGARDRAGRASDAPDAERRSRRSTGAPRSYAAGVTTARNVGIVLAIAGADRVPAGRRGLRRRSSRGRSRWPSSACRVRARLGLSPLPARHRGAAAGHPRAALRRGRDARARASPARAR